jgi:hypothetical protein
MSKVYDCLCKNNYMPMLSPFQAGQKLFELMLNILNSK